MITIIIIIVIITVVRASSRHQRASRYGRNCAIIASFRPNFRGGPKIRSSVALDLKTPLESPLWLARRRMARFL